MKRLLSFIPIILLLLLNSCTELPVGPDAVSTAVAQTQIALTRMALPSPTLNPNIPNMVIWMNNDLAISNPLESTLDAEYHVLNLSFRNLEGSSNLRFQVDVSCMCMNSSDCCVPERTFVVIIESLKRNSGTAVTQMPPDVSEIVVICSNHETKAKVGAISAPWQDVKGYLQGNVSGYQLGALANPVVVP